PVAPPTCCVRLTTWPATGLTTPSRLLPTPPRAGFSPSGRMLSTAVPVLPSVGSRIGSVLPSPRPAVSPPTRPVTGLSRPPSPARPPVSAPTALVALSRTAVRGCGLVGSALSRPPALATVSPRPLTRPPTPVSRPPGRPVPDTVSPRLLTTPPTWVSTPSTGAPNPVAAPTC